MLLRNEGPGGFVNGDTGLIVGFEQAASPDLPRPLPISRDLPPPRPISRHLPPLAPPPTAAALTFSHLLPPSPTCSHLPRPAPTVSDV